VGDADSGSATAASASPTAVRRYHRAVRDLSLVALIVIAMLSAVTVVLWLVDRRRNETPVRLAIGLVPGLVGALAVLAMRTDLVPDELDETVIRIVVIGVTAIALIGTWFRLSRT